MECSTFLNDVPQELRFGPVKVRKTKLRDGTQLRAEQLYHKVFQM